MAVLVGLILGGLASGQQAWAQSANPNAAERLAVLDGNTYAPSQQVDGPQATQARMQVIPLHESAPPYPVLRPRISIQLKEATVEEALDQIMRRSTIRLAYLRETVDVEKRVTLDREQVAVWEVLRAVLQGTGLHITHLSGEQFVLSRVPETEHRVEVFALQQPMRIESAPVERLQLGVQQGSIAGRVTEAETGDPIPGVNVVVVGTQQGAATDQQGRYTISGVEVGTYTLQASFIGYGDQTQEDVQVQEGQTTTVNFALQREAAGLDEVVVVGYGEQQRREVTGSIAEIEGSDLEDIEASSPLDALQGQASGVQVSTSSGRPGAGTRILVRGTSSISAGAEPLIVVDGFPINQSLGGQGGVNSLAAVNSSDIESIEVLKDAAATAIYGSRGANGVVLITTKSGDAGTGISVDMKLSSQEPANFVESAGAQEWLSLVDRAYANDGLEGEWDPVADGGLVSEFIDNPQSYLTRSMIEQQAQQGGTDWLDPIFRNGSIWELNVSSSNSFEDGSAYISGRFRENRGLVEHQRLRQYGARLNVDYEPVSGLRTGVRSNLTYTENRRPLLGEGTGASPEGGRTDDGNRAGYGAAIIGGGALPILPLRVNGAPFDPMGARNPVFTNDPGITLRRNDQYRAILSGFAEYSMFENLSVRGEASADLWQSSFKMRVDERVRVADFGQYGEDRQIALNFKGVANYNRGFGAHSVEVTAGAEREERKSTGTDFRAESLTTIDEWIGEPNPDNVIVMAATKFRPFRILSFFGRASYGYQGRYHLDISFRRDAASVFGEVNRWGNFPAVSANWIVTEESFAQDWGPLNFLKVRASFGRTGNADIPFVLEDNFTTWPAYGGGDGVVVSELAAQDIGWEEINSTDVGIDFGLFEDRVTGSVGVYRQDVNDMLLQVPIPPSQGIGLGSNTIWSNIGSIQNQGIEAELSTVNLDLENGFRWETDFNVSTVDNSVEALRPELDERNRGIEVGNTVTRAGGDLATYFLPDFAGIDPETGYPMIWERDQEAWEENGVTRRTGERIIATSSNVANNRFVHEGKTGLPDWYGGMRHRFSYKGVNLSAFFTFQGGNFLFDNNGYNVNGTSNIRADIVGDFWTPNNTDADLPRLSLNSQTRDGQPLEIGQTTRFLQDGDFLRLRSLQLGYTLPTSLVQNLSLQNVRVYVRATNLATWTRFEGFDPEVAQFDSNRRNRNLLQGFVDDDPYPHVRTFTGGINVGL